MKMGRRKYWVICPHRRKAYAEDLVAILRFAESAVNEHHLRLTWLLEMIDSDKESRDAAGAGKKRAL